MNEFTKGKWNVAPDGCVILPNGKWYLPCRTLDSNNETMANARLIAAAPEMYDALDTCAKILYGLHEFAAAQKVHKLIARIDGKETLS